MGRFSVTLDVANDIDVIKAGEGIIPAAQIRRETIRGVVDTGATRLVLPGDLVARLGLPESGTLTVRDAGGREVERPMVGHVELTLQGRTSVFTAVIEPGRSDAVVGAIVLRVLDFVADCTGQALIPRDPKGILVEIE